MAEKEYQIGNWHYIGDVSIEYGGSWYNLDPQDIKYGYIESVRVTDLDSGCGFTDAVMIERQTVHSLDDKKRIKEALRCCGLTLQDLRGKGKESVLLMIADALSWYGYAETAEDFMGPHRWIVLTDPDTNPVFDGWRSDPDATAELHEGYGGDLWDYVLGKLD